MQYKKKLVNDRILDAGRAEYLKNGFRGGNIAAIATAAGVPVGNLYRYFDGKAGLLDAIVKPAYTELPKIIRKLSTMDEENNFSIEELMAVLASQLLQIFDEYGKEVLILVDKCATTRYDDFNEIVAKLVLELFLNKLYPEPSAVDGVMAELIAKAFLSSIFDILRKNLPRETTEEMFLRVLKYYFFNVQERK
ncbi:MAG: TetR/AcrR family transcriptional regulator [Clostridiales bacterium]|jgi:AcrR family transcriptional regulator|nr:TetR/AcrR family transcriptional regulator [Clostridiales bacterium]